MRLAGQNVQQTNHALPPMRGGKDVTVQNAPPLTQSSICIDRHDFTKPAFVKLGITLHRMK